VGAGNLGQFAPTSWSERVAYLWPLASFNAHSIRANAALREKKEEPELSDAYRDILVRANARAILIEALGDAHRWLDELLSDPRQTFGARAQRGHLRRLRERLTLTLVSPVPATRYSPRSGTQNSASGD
jgi:hypothetical protein